MLLATRSPRTALLRRRGYQPSRRNVALAPVELDRPPIQSVSSVVHAPEEGPPIPWHYPDGPEAHRRAERRSPAAVFGRKKMPAISLPSELENKMERLWGAQDVKTARAAWKLFLNAPADQLLLYRPPNPTRKPKNTLLPLPYHKTAQGSLPAEQRGFTLDLAEQPLKLMPSRTTKELVYAHAAGYMPTQYAILRNLMREVKMRTGWGEEEGDEKGGVQIVDFGSGYGAGAWAAIATFESPMAKKNTYVHIEPNRTVKDLAQTLLQPGTPGPVNNWANLHYRSWTNYLSHKPEPFRSKRSIAVSAFQLSGIKLPAGRRRILRQMWESNAEVIVVAEEATKATHNLIAEARQFLLELSQEELDRAAGIDTPNAHSFPPKLKSKNPLLPQGPPEKSLNPSYSWDPKMAAKEAAREAKEARLAEKKKKAEEVAAAEAAVAAPPAPTEQEETTTRMSGEEEATNVDHLEPLAAPDSAVTAPVIIATRGRRKPGARLPVGYLDEIKKINDREHAIDPASGREKFELGGVEYEEADFDPPVEEEFQMTKIERNAKGYALARQDRILGAHILAPCPHEERCPLVDTPDTCHFTQNLEQPAFSRMIKDTKLGVKEVKMSYVIFRRGPRPTITDEDRGAGRIGEVEREVLQSLKEKMPRRMEQNEAGIYEEGAEEEEEGEVVVPKTDFAKLRKEILEWPRMIYPPILKKGHIITDACTASGEIHRVNYSKSLGKQVWYDLKHSEWGDAIPYTEGSSKPEVRTRGIRTLIKPKRNKIVIDNGKISGLQGLTKLEYRDVEEVMKGLGVTLPDFPGKRDKYKDREPREPTGWDAPTGWGVGDEIYGYDGSQDRARERAEKERADRAQGIVDAVGGGPAPRRTRDKQQPKGEWTLDGGWQPADDGPTETELAAAQEEAELDEEESFGSKPTPLHGAQEIDPRDQSLRNPLAPGIAELDAEFRAALEPTPVSEKYDPNAAPAMPTFSNPHFHPPKASQLEKMLSKQRKTRQELLDETDFEEEYAERNPGRTPLSPARHPFDADVDADSTDTFSLLSGSKINLGGLGPGWMEEHSDDLTPAERKRAAADRAETLQTLGIHLKKGELRTVQDDWRLLEEWHAKTAPERREPTRAEKRLKELKSNAWKIKKAKEPKKAKGESAPSKK